MSGKPDARWDLGTTTESGHQAPARSFTFLEAVERVATMASHEELVADCPTFFETLYALSSTGRD